MKGEPKVYRKKYLRKFLTIALLLNLVLLLFTGLSSAARIIESDPEDGATDVSVDKWIIIRFNTTMDTESVEDSLKISPSLDPYGYRIEWSNNDREIIIKPNTALVTDEEYTVEFPGAKDTDGNLLENPSVKFKTESPPEILEVLSGMFWGMWNAAIGLIPGLILFIVILIIGYIIAKIAAWIFSKALNKVGFDKAMEKVGVGEQLRKIGVKTASKFLGIFIFWFIFVIVLQIAIAAFGVPSITNILAPIVLFIPRILIAAVIILVGLYVANVIAKKLLEMLQKTPIGRTLNDIDGKTKTSGISMVKIISLFIKIFILLFFVQIALEIVAIGLLSEFITPVLLLMPLILIAMIIIIIGLVVTEIIRKILLKLFSEFEIHKLIAPVEETIGKRGVILNILFFVVKLFIMLIFIQLAIGVLNSTGAFNQLAQLINTIILWMPNVLAAIVIILLGFWFAGWVNQKVMVYGKQVQMPFTDTIATAMKFLIIYLAGVMAIAQMGFEVPILYIVTAIIIGAIFIGLGAGFAIGSKDIFSNLSGYFHNNKVLRIGTWVTIDGKYTGKVQNISHYTTTILADNGEKIIIPNSQLMKSVIVESAVQA